MPTWQPHDRFIPASPSKLRRTESERSTPARPTKRRIDRALTLKDVSAGTTVLDPALYELAKTLPLPPSPAPSTLSNFSWNGGHADEKWEISETAIDWDQRLGEVELAWKKASERTIILPATITPSARLRSSSLGAIPSSPSTSSLVPKDGKFEVPELSMGSVWESFLAEADLSSDDDSVDGHDEALPKNDEEISKTFQGLPSLKPSVAERRDVSISPLNFSRPSSRLQHSVSQASSSSSSSSSSSPSSIFSSTPKSWRLSQPSGSTSYFDRSRRSYSPTTPSESLPVIPEGKEMTSSTESWDMAESFVPMTAIWSHRNSRVYDDALISPVLTQSPRFSSNPSPPDLSSPISARFQDASEPNSPVTPDLPYNSNQYSRNGMCEVSIDWGVEFGKLGGGIQREWGEEDEEDSMSSGDDGVEDDEDDTIKLSDYLEIDNKLSIEIWGDQEGVDEIIIEYGVAY